MASDSVKTDFAAQSRQIVDLVDKLLKGSYASPEAFLAAKARSGLDILHPEWTAAYVARTAPSAPDNEEKREAYDIAKNTVLPKFRELTNFFVQLKTSPTANGGKRWTMPRKMSRTYCKKTPCRKMGFTQRSSCRPYKNCFTRRARRSG